MYSEKDDDSSNSVAISEADKCICIESELNNVVTSDALATKSHTKGPHAIYSFENWTFLSAECEIDERIEHYKRLVEETEQKIQCRDDMILSLQNQLRKIENMCKKGHETSEHYRFKYCVATNELNNLKKLCAQYKENMDKLIQINEELVPKDDFLNVQEQIQYWKTLCDELSKELEEKQIKNDQKSTQTNLDTTNLQEDLNLLKQKCSAVEDMLQIQNKTIDELIVKWVEEFEKVNKQDANSRNIAEEMFNSISNETAAQNKSLQIILDENKSIKEELLSIKEQILKSPTFVKEEQANTQNYSKYKCKHQQIDEDKSSIQSKSRSNAEQTDTPKIYNKCKCGYKRKVSNVSEGSQEIQTENVKGKSDSLLEQIEQLKKSSTETNQSNENIIANLHHAIDALENEKLKWTAKYDELSKRHFRDYSELQNKTLQLNTAIEEVNKLKGKISELQLLLEELNKQGEHSSSAKLEEFEQMQQLLQQYKEQVEFKKLENEKLRKREQELQVEIQNYEYDTERKCRECAAEANKYNTAMIQLQNKYDKLVEEHKEEENKRLEEKQEVMNLLELKNKEIQKLQSQTSTLNSNLNIVQSEVKKIENKNDRSLTEISCLYKHKESQWFEISHKYNEQENCILNLRRENANLKQQLRELEHKLGIYDDNVVCSNCFHNPKSCDNNKTELLDLLQNVDMELTKFLKENEDIKLPQATTDDFLCQTRQLITVLNQQKHVEGATRISYSESSAVDENIIAKKCSDSVVSETQSGEVSEFEYKSPITEAVIRDYYLCTTMKQMLVGLEELKKDLKSMPLHESKETYTDDHDASPINTYNERQPTTSDMYEKNLDTIEEEIENQLSIS